MRSVQSAKSLSATGTSTRANALTMFVRAWPARMRVAHASVDGLMCAKSRGIVRVALLPIWWHVTQPFVLMTFSHSGWLPTFATAPLPPGANSPGSGTFSIEYQYAAG